MKSFFSSIIAFVITLVIFGTIYPVFHMGVTGDIVKKHQNRLAGQGGILDDIFLYPYFSEDSDEQIIRKGQFAHYNDAEANIIICHGFSCDHHDVSILRYVFDSGKYNVLSFDFRAHGDLNHRDGIRHYCTFGKNEIFDLLSAIDFIKNYPDKKISEKPIFIYGFSMGAVVAIETMSRYPGTVKGLILDCPFDSSGDVVERGINSISFEIFGYKFNLPGANYLKEYAFHPYIQVLVKYMLRFLSQFDTRNIATDLHLVSPVESIKKVDVPILFIHCKHDRKIPLEAVMRIYNEAPGFKRLWITNGKGHFGSFFYRPETYKIVVQAFLDRLMKPNQEKDVSAVQEKVIDDDDNFDNNTIVENLLF